MRAVVIGGGVVGLCSAYSLAKKGIEVTVVDPNDGPRTSLVNAGMIVPSHIIPLAAPGMVGVGMKMMLQPRSPFWIRPRMDRDLFRWMMLFARSCKKEHVEKSKGLLLKLNAASKGAYLDFTKELEGFDVEQKGLLMICKKEATLEEESHVAGQVRELGLPANVLNAKQITEIDPTIRIDAIGGVHYPADCHFSPPVFMSALTNKLLELGVNFLSGRVTALNSKDGKLGSVSVDSKELESDVFILAAGAWSNRLARQIGLSIPLQAGKGYSFNIESPPERPTICSILMEGRVAVTPMPGGVRFGGTMEIGPTDDRVDPARVQGIRDAIPDYYPAFKGADLKSQEVGMGLRPCSPDGLPYLGKPKAISNLIIATGHAMMGMSLGPITGRLVAEIVAGERPSIPIGDLSPDRFG